MKFRAVSKGLKGDDMVAYMNYDVPFWNVNTRWIEDGFPVFSKKIVHFRAGSYLMRTPAHVALFCDLFVTDWLTG